MTNEQQLKGLSEAVKELDRLFNIRHKVIDCLLNEVEQMKKITNPADKIKPGDELVLKIAGKEIGRTVVASEDEIVYKSKGYDKAVQEQNIDYIINKVRKEGLKGSNEFDLHLRDEIVEYILNRETK